MISSNRQRVCAELHRALEDWREANEELKDALGRFTRDGDYESVNRRLRWARLIRDEYQTLIEASRVQTALGSLFRPEYEALVAIDQQVGDKNVELLMDQKRIGMPGPVKIERGQVVELSVSPELGPKRTTPVLSGQLLAELPALRTLGLHQLCVDDFQPLGQLQHLNHLRLTGAALEGLDSQFPTLPSVTELGLSYGRLADASILHRLPHLGHLSIEEVVSGQGDLLKTVGSLKRLRGLTLHGSRRESFNLSQLQHLRSLWQLSLRGMTVSNLSCASRMPRLEDLSLSDVDLKSYRGLTKHPRLRELLFYESDVPPLERMPELPKLETLTLMETGIRSLMGIERFPSLLSVDLTANPVNQLINYLSDLGAAAPLLSLPELDRVGWDLAESQLDMLNDRYEQSYGPGRRPFHR